MSKNEAMDMVIRLLESEGAAPLQAITKALEYLVASNDLGMTDFSEDEMFRVADLASLVYMTRVELGV